MQERMRSYFFSLSLFLFARAHERVGGGGRHQRMEGDNTLRLVVLRDYVK